MGVDRDADGRLDAVDNCQAVANASQLDGDADGLGNACDNCTLAVVHGVEAAVGVAV